MKSLKMMKTCLGLSLLLGSFILSGCGGEAGGGSWDAPGTLPTGAAVPTVTAVVPVVNATAVPINTKIITAAFSRGMNPATLTTTTFTLTCDGTQIAGGGAVTYLDAGNVATLPLPAATNLPSNALCTARMTTGATGLNGNTLASDYVWTFTTGAASDTTRPLVLSTVPATTNPGPTLVVSNTKIQAIFNENMSPASITAAGAMTVKEEVSGNPVPGAAIPVTYTISNKTATFIPLNPLVDNVTYTVTIKGIGPGAATDMANNALAGNPALPLDANDYVWSFTPTVSVVPQPLAINLGAAETFGIASRAGLTSTGVTVVNGDVALAPQATCADATGGPGGASQTCLVQPVYATTTGMTVNGTIYWAGDTIDNGLTANTVTTDLNNAWIEGMAKVNTQLPIAADELGGKTFIPGVYENANLKLSAGMVATLDAQNDANAIFIFKVTLGGDLVDSGTLLLPTRIDLINSAQAKNVWFVIGRDATIGSGTTWNGNILANRTVTVLDGSTVTGRVLGGAGGAGAISLTGAASPSVTIINVPQ